MDGAEKCKVVQLEKDAKRIVTVYRKLHTRDGMIALNLSRDYITACQDHTQSYIRIQKFRHKDNFEVTRRESREQKRGLPSESKSCCEGTV